MFKIVGSLLRRGRQLAIEPQRPFDFEVHGNDAATVYARQRHLYIELSQVVQRLVKNHLEDQNIQVSSVDARAKEVDSFRNKARSASDYDPEAPKYRAPLLEIDDLAGVRIV